MWLRLSCSSKRKSFGKGKVGRSGKNVVAAGFPCKVPQLIMIHKINHINYASRLGRLLSQPPLFYATMMAQLLLLQET
jgi:hypothetical protein